MNLADRIRGDFPILKTEMHGHPLIYLDNAATTQKPQSVIDALVNYYSNDNANIHRGLYELSQRATDRYEAARHKVAKFLNAGADEECIFVRGSTEGINLVASSWGRVHLQPDDEVIVTGLEHHSNIVPWQMACAASGARLRVWYPQPDGTLLLDGLDELLNERTKMVAVQHVSNALGTIHDVEGIAQRVRATGSRLLIDGAQWVAHHATDVQQLGCDFYVFSGHKLYGPTGIGVLWGRGDLLESLPPYQGGGDMIESVSFEKTTYARLPNRFEAGTANIAGAIGLGAAIDYVTQLGFSEIAEYENQLLEYATGMLLKIPGLRIIGSSSHKAAVISFVCEQPSIAAMDVATFLANRGIAIRTGHHCCMPLMGLFKLSGTSRVSMAMYNTREEIDQLYNALSALVDSRRSAASAEQTGTSPTAAAGEEQPAEPREIAFAASVADSAQAAADELADEFLEFDDRESKMELLMELGLELPDYFESLKRISTPVPGCMSEVYLVGRPLPEDPARFEFAADSNAQIVRGLIAVLEKIFSGQPAAEIIEFDIEQFFRRIGLDQFISTQRRSGLDGMVRRVKTLAGAIVDRQPADPN
jgi:cysteine desulfurase / selenocysteine lyase